MLTGRTLYSLPRRDPVYEAIVEDRLHPELMRFHAKFESLSHEGIGQYCTSRTNVGSTIFSRSLSLYQAQIPPHLYWTHYSKILQYSVHSKLPHILSTYDAALTHSSLTFVRTTPAHRFTHAHATRAPGGSGEPRGGDEPPLGLAWEGTGRGGNFGPRATRKYGGGVSLRVRLPAGRRLEG